MKGQFNTTKRVYNLSPYQQLTIHSSPSHEIFVNNYILQQFREKALFKDFHVFNHSLDQVYSDVMTNKQLIRSSIESVKQQSIDIPNIRSQERTQLDLKISNQRDLMSNQNIIKKRTTYKENTALQGSFDSLNDNTYYHDTQTKSILPMQYNQYISQRSELHDASRTIEVRNHRKDMSKHVELDTSGKSDMAITQSDLIDKTNIQFTIDNTQFHYKNNMEDLVGLQQNGTNQLNQDNINMISGATIPGRFTLKFNAMRSKSLYKNAIPSISKTGLVSGYIQNEYSNTNSKDSFTINSRRVSALRHSFGNKNQLDKFITSNDQQQSTSSILQQSQYMNKDNKLMYTQTKKENFNSSISNPPYIAHHQRMASKFGNNPSAKLSQSLSNIACSTIIQKKLIHSNQESTEYEKSDKRSKSKDYGTDFITGIERFQENPISKKITRLMSSYRDESKHIHFSKNYNKRMEQFPSIFRKSNGEFTAFASAQSQHKLVESKAFLPSMMQTLKL